MIFFVLCVNLIVSVCSAFALRTVEVSVTNAVGNTLKTDIQIHEGVSINSGLISESQPYGLVQCVRECLLQQACVGVVHHEFTCRLGKDQAGFLSSSAPVNSVYVNKTTITNDLNQILTSECNVASCSTRHMCQPLTTGYQCIAKECAAFPFDVTNTFVNLTVGATNNLTCADNMTQSGSPIQTCGMDGNWTPGDLTCAPKCNVSMGYVSYPEACFHTVRGRYSQSSALDYCQLEGATLARIDSQAKYDTMVTEVGTGGLYYIEGYDANMDENWVYSDGSPMTFFNWYVSTYTPGPCIAYYPGQGITKMDCAVGHYFICEVR